MKENFKIIGWFLYSLLITCWGFWFDFLAGGYVLFMVLLATGIAKPTEDAVVFAWYQHLICIAIVIWRFGRTMIWELVSTMGWVCDEELTLTFNKKDSDV